MLEEKGIGCIAFSPLAQGMLTNRYLNDIPADSRAGKQNTFLKRDQVTEERVGKVRKLNEIAQARGQTMAADGHCLGAAPPGRHLGPDRRQPGAADRRLVGALKNLSFSMRSWRRSKPFWHSWFAWRGRKQSLPRHFLSNDPALLKVERNRIYGGWRRLSPLTPAYSSMECAELI